MKGERDICRNQGDDVASFHHKQVYFMFSFVAGVMTGFHCWPNGLFFFFSFFQELQSILHGPVLHSPATWV